MNTSAKKKRSTQKYSREQSGIFHVYFRGNGRQNVFYYDRDYIKFLEICNEVSQLYQTKICAIVIMDNHVHMNISTNQLTEFMRALLIRFVRWYNLDKGWAEQIFKRPFGSAKLISRGVIKENLGYILSNPVTDKICKQPWEYKWSSYLCYFEDNLCYISKYITIDKSLVESIFIDKASMNLYMSDYMPDKEIPKDSNWHRAPDYIVINHLNNLLNGRNLYTLTRPELHEIMIRLKYDKDASFRQIAGLMHESYAEVRRFFVRRRE